MRKTITTLFAVLALVGFVLAQDQEKKIQRRDLPPAVEKTVSAQSQGATIRGFSEETEHGHIYYEVEMMISGHSKDILMDKDGGIVEIEEQVSLESLPPEVRKGLQEKAGPGKIVGVESLTKRDKLVAYEAKVQANGKRKEIQVGPDGNSLDHEE